MVPSSDRAISLRQTNSKSKRTSSQTHWKLRKTSYHTPKQRTMKGLMQQRIVPSLLVWLWVVAQTVLSLSSNNKPTRRDFVNSAIIGTAGLVESSSFPTISWAAEGGASNNSKLPFCVIGANGKTGTKCVQDILGRGMPVRATSRSGVYFEAEEGTSNLLLLPTVCDVTAPPTINAAVKGTRAVIFAASASKQGGTPSEGEMQQWTIQESSLHWCMIHVMLVASFV